MYFTRMDNHTTPLASVQRSRYAIRVPSGLQVWLWFSAPLVVSSTRSWRPGVREARRRDVGRVQGLVDGHVEPPDGRAADAIACPEGEEAVVLPEDGCGVG